jgi:hypothetical protein
LKRLCIYTLLGKPSDLMAAMMDVNLPQRRGEGRVVCLFISTTAATRDPPDALESGPEGRGGPRGQALEYDISLYAFLARNAPDTDLVGYPAYLKVNHLLSGGTSIGCTGPPEGVECVLARVQEGQPGSNIVGHPGHHVPVHNLAGKQAMLLAGMPHPPLELL